ncbi:MAG: MGMT family protein [Syntrophaceae bacterium]|nr:MGMT family protein [Syntrophaceae bacterium]
MYYQIIDVKKESIGIIWRFLGNKPLIERIFLPCSRNQLVAKIKREYSETSIAERNTPENITEIILGLYAGSEVIFDYSLLNLAKLTEFSAKVLKQTSKIPRGEVTTYSGLAAKIGSPAAARAVGTALANNPFPLVIPCHRIVRADGSLGGFGGGIKMKKELLDKEGVVSDKKGRVKAKCFSLS